MNELEKSVALILKKYADLEVDEEVWEDEEEEFKELAQDIVTEEEDPLDDIFASYRDDVIKNLTHIAEAMADARNIRVAYRIERTIQKLREENNDKS